MPVIAEQIEDNVILVQLSGNCPPDEVNTLFLTRVFPACETVYPETMHILYDMDILEWTFNDFINYLEIVRERRATYDYPSNIQQFFLGRSKWSESLRDWLYNQYGEEVGVFTDYASVTAYIELHRNANSC